MNVQFLLTSTCFDSAQQPPLNDHRLGTILSTGSATTAQQLDQKKYILEEAKRRIGMRGQLVLDVL